MRQSKSSRARLWRQFLVGLVFWAALAHMVSMATGHRFLLVFPAMLGGASLCCGLGLIWVTLWARREESRLGQFTVGSLFFLTLFASLFFSFVQWLAAGLRFRDGAPNAAVFFAVAVVCSLCLLIAIPFSIRMTESAVWFAAWFVGRPSVRRWFRGRRDRVDP